jgi:hypothetical protein
VAYTEIKLCAPEAGFNSIIRLLKGVYELKKPKIPDLAKKLGVRESWITSRIPVCILLRLVVKDTTGTYQVTETGSMLIDPLLPREEKSELFKKCLLLSPYRDLIIKISEKKNELSYEDFGEGLAYILRKNWRTLTKRLYGKKFASWLNAAGLIEKVAPNKFRLKETELREKITVCKEQDSKYIASSTLYEVGKILGILETIIPSEEERRNFEDKISTLKLLLKDRIDVNAMLDMLKRNFQLAIEMGDAKVYKSNIEFVSRRIQEEICIFSREE